MTLAVRWVPGVTLAVRWVPGVTLAVRWVPGVTLADTRRWQSEDESIDCMLRHKETRTHSPPFAQIRDQDNMTKCLCQQWDRLTTVDFLYRKKKASCDTEDPACGPVADEMATLSCGSLQPPWRAYGS